MVIRGEYSSVAVTGEKEGPLALRRGYITPQDPGFAGISGLAQISPRSVERDHNLAHVTPALQMA